MLTLGVNGAIKTSLFLSRVNNVRANAGAWCQIGTLWCGLRGKNCTQTVFSDGFVGRGAEWSELTDLFSCELPPGVDMLTIDLKFACYK